VSISTNDIKPGMALSLSEGLFAIVEYQHVKPGKGHAFVRTKLKNLDTGAVLERNFRADEKVTLARIEKKEMQFLYRDGSDYVFMDTQSYEQLHVGASEMGTSVDYLTEGDNAVVHSHGARVVNVELPASVVLDVAATEPGIKGDRVSGATKPATLSTGKVITVPLFVDVGDKVKVDTRTGDYLTRVQ
jgi:elongation factor P